MLKFLSKAGEDAYFLRLCLKIVAKSKFPIKHLRWSGLNQMGFFSKITVKIKIKRIEMNPSRILLYAQKQQFVL